MCVCVCFSRFCIEETGVASHRFLSSDLGCSSEVVCKIVVDSGAALLKYSKADLENTALGLSQEDITKVSSAILSILE